MSDTKCIVMRKQLTVSNEKVTPCCNFTKNIPIETYEEDIEEYAKLLDQGIRIDECKLCWDAEDSGMTSVRQSGNQSSSSFEGDGITSLDIRIHNKCNLACNMCHPTFSTLWGKLIQQEENNYIPSDRLDKVNSLLSNVRKISLQGGEPFYGDEYVKFVDSLENKSQVELDTFTNVVTVDIDAIERWSNELREFRINASVDGIGESFEKIRWPAKWQKFERNSKRIYDIIGSGLNFFYTIQAENITSILPFVKWRDKVAPKSKIVFTTVYHNDEITYKGLTEEERNLFLSQKDELLSLFTNDPLLGEWENREYNDIKSIFSLVENMTVDQELIDKRNQFDANINNMRYMHTKNEY